MKTPYTSTFPHISDYIAMEYGIPSRAMLNRGPRNRRAAIKRAREMAYYFCWALFPLGLVSSRRSHIIAEYFGVKPLTIFNAAAKIHNRCKIAPADNQRVAEIHKGLTQMLTVAASRNPIEVMDSLSASSASSAVEPSLP